MTHRVTLLMHEFVTHDTRRFITTRPPELDWRPGQSVELSMETRRWRGHKRPFTVTSLQGDQALEFIIKRYPLEGVTQALHALESGATLTLGEGFGRLRYRGPGVFIAAGAGITPFLAIFRDLEQRNELAGQSLLLSNKSERDVICGEELRYLLGERCMFTFTRRHQPSHEGNRIDAAFLRGHIGDLDQCFYVCGPRGFVDSVGDSLVTLGVHPDRLVYEH